jgi:hypothetical protein
VRLVSKEIKSLVDEPSIWKHLCQRDYGATFDLQNEWKQKYITHHRKSLVLCRLSQFGSKPRDFASSMNLLKLLKPLNNGNKPTVDVIVTFDILLVVEKLLELVQASEDTVYQQMRNSGLSKFTILQQAAKHFGQNLLSLYMLIFATSVKESVFGLIEKLDTFPKIHESAVLTWLMWKLKVEIPNPTQNMPLVKSTDEAFMQVLKHIETSTEYKNFMSQ